MSGFTDPIVKRVRAITGAAGRLLLRLLTWIEKMDTDDVEDFDDKEPYIIEEFEDVFAREVVVYLPILSLSLVAALWTIREGYTTLSVWGLGLSFLGSLSIARSSVRGKVGIVVNVSDHVSQTVRAGSKSVPELGALRAKCRHTVHGVFGAVMLAAGFVIQIAATI